MRKAYPIGTEVTVMGKIDATITAVTFYDGHEKYLLSRVNDWGVVEEWFTDAYFKLCSNKKIGFDL